MKKVVFFAIIIIFTMSAFPSDNDILTIGKSKNRYDIGKIEKGQIADTKLNKKISMGDMVKSSLKSDVFVIGEMHNSYDCH
ncbi:MAG: hypothetical protein KAS21_04055, partial [Candidatus Aminicenantes bacterium]|nr:hypothetical protein [Candidatus Aminicenantes bacterium]